MSLLQVMTLKNISVRKFIELFDIISSDIYDTETDRDVAVLVCFTGKPEEHFLNMTMANFRKEANRLAFLKLENIKPEAKKFIHANGKTYAPVYNFNKLTAGQFVDVVSFAKEPTKIIENLPKIMAALCVPTRRKMNGKRKLLPYGSVSHAEVVADMENASIYDAYSIAVFFWNVWTVLLEDTGDYLVRETLAAKMMQNKTLTTDEVTALLNILEVYGDGITARKK